MKIHEYTDCCLKFAEDSKTWNHLDLGHFYVTDHTDLWTENTDNRNDGLDVSWAFHKSEKEIQEQAAQQFVDIMVELLWNCDDDITVMRSIIENHFMNNGI